MTILYNVTQLKETRRQLRRDSTKAEKIMWNALRNNQSGYKFRRQYSIGPYITDFCCPRRKMIIEVDGGYHYESEEQIIYDKERAEYLREVGFKILRFKNKEVEYNINEVLRKIMIYLNSLTIPKPSPC